MWSGGNNFQGSPQSYYRGRYVGRGTSYVPPGVGHGMWTEHMTSTGLAGTRGSGRSLMAMQQQRRQQLFPESSLDNSKSRLTDIDPFRFPHIFMSSDSEVGGSYRRNHESADPSDEWIPIDRQHYPNSFSNLGGLVNDADSDDFMDSSPPTPPPRENAMTATTAGTDRSPKLKANIIDWETISEEPIIAKRNKMIMEDLQGNSPSAVHGWNASESRPGIFSSTYDNIRSKRPGTAMSTSSNMSDVISDDHRSLDERMRERYGTMVGGNTSTNTGVDLKSAAAVGMPLDRVILQNNITYDRKQRMTWSSCEHGDVDYRSRPNLQFAERKRSYSSTFDQNEDMKRVSSFHTIPKRSREQLKTVVVDGTSLGFEYGDNLHFDWKGILICVESLVETGCTDILVFVPESRINQPGMSKNEHFIHLLKGYLRPCWDRRCEKRYAIKTAYLRNGLIISNNVWKEAQSVNSAWKYLQDRTFEFEFVPPSKIRFSAPMIGQSLEEALKSF